MFYERNKEKKDQPNLLKIDGVTYIQKKQSLKIMLSHKFNIFTQIKMSTPVLVEENFERGVIYELWKERIHTQQHRFQLSLIYSKIQKMNS